MNRVISFERVAEDFEMLDSYECLLGDIRDAELLFSIRDKVVHVDIPAGEECPWDVEARQTSIARPSTRIFKGIK